MSIRIIVDNVDKDKDKGYVIAHIKMYLLLFPVISYVLYRLFIGEIFGNI